MEHLDVSPDLITIGIAACPPLQRIYIKGGGTVQGLRSHMSHVLAAALSAPVAEPQAPVIPLSGRRRAHKAYAGPDRRIPVNAGAPDDEPGPGHRAA